MEEPHPTKILVTGANGQLGTEFRHLSKSCSSVDFIFTDYDELDITRPSHLAEFFSIHPPDYVVNCAAYTAVDKAEEETEKAMLLNAEAAGFLATACKDNFAKLIHLSTDYVFSGESHLPYAENSPTAPQSVYGKSKLAGERAVIESGIGMVIRTSWLYSAFGHNFVKTILKNASAKPALRVVSDQVGSPTWTADLARAILDIVAMGKERFYPEIFHYANVGVCSWFDFAWEIVETSGIACQITPISTKDYPLPAKRPHYSVLDSGKIRSLYGVKTPYWKESLRRCLLHIEELSNE